MPNLFPPSEPWTPTIDWDSEAGQSILRLISALPNKPILLTIYGSAPLQMTLDNSFLSADVDIAVPYDLGIEMQDAVKSLGLSYGQSKCYIQTTPEGAFRTSPKWRDRCFTHKIGEIQIRFPHPVDILIGKMNRMEEKDFKAFQLVQSITGHPSENELIKELREAVELYSLGHYQEWGRSFRQNTEILWPRIYGRKIDVDQEIILPGETTIKNAYKLHETGLKASLKEIGQQSRRG